MDIIRLVPEARTATDGLVKVLTNKRVRRDYVTGVPDSATAGHSLADI
jgi:hypothetical protein